MRSIFALCIMAVAGSLSAGTFTANGGSGSSTINAGGGADYLSLAAAAADFNSFGGGCTGNWTLLVASNLTEPNAVNFANETNTFSVTIKPAPSTSAVVTFTTTTRPGTTGTIWDASILLGPRGFTENTNFANMDNFTIDGSNSGGTSRDLTLETPNVGPQIQRNMIRVVGPCDNVTVKNCIIRNGPTGTGDNTCVDFNVRKSATAVMHVPNSGKVINCELNVNNGGIGQGVVCRPVGTVDAGFAIADMLVENCDINASLRAVHLNINTGAIVTRNRIKMSQYTASVGSNNRLEVIFHPSANGSIGTWTTEISRNNISQMHTVAIGGYNSAIGVGAGVTGTGCTYNILNNIMTGWETTQTVTNNATWLSRAIALNTVNSAATYNIYNNSINMVDLTAIETAPAGGADTNKRLSAVSLVSAGGFTGTLNFVNNIVRYTQHQGALITNTPLQAIGGTLNFDNNAYFIGTGGTTFAYLNDAPYAALSNWQTGPPVRDAASTSEDPFAPSSGGKWISQSNLHLDNAPSATLQGVTIPAVTVDIDGDPRPGSNPAKGADEFVPASSICDWNLY